MPPTVVQPGSYGERADAAVAAGGDVVRRVRPEGDPTVGPRVLDALFVLCPSERQEGRGQDAGAGVEAL
jgi:hypothetical protein